MFTPRIILEEEASFAFLVPSELMTLMRTFKPPKPVIICDSITKCYSGIRNTTIAAYPGATIQLISR